MNDLLGALVLDAIVLITIGLAVGYLFRVRMPRPPAGLFVWSDIAIMVALLVAMPFAYLNMPVVLVCMVFGITVFVGIQFTLAGVIGGRGAAAAAMSLCALELVAYIMDWSAVLMCANNAALVIVAAGVTNMWVQSAMKPALVAGLAAALVVYDTVATGLTSVTLDFVHMVNGIPFAPMLAVRYEPEPIMMGLGDTLMLVLWPLVAIKAYGKIAGVYAIVIDLVLMAVVFAGFATETIAWIPLLTPLGTLIVAQYLFWRRNTPLAVPVRVSIEKTLCALSAARHSGSTNDDGTQDWIALHEGKIIGTGGSPGAARLAARAAGAKEVPVISLAAGVSLPSSTHH